MALFRSKKGFFKAVSTGDAERVRAYLADEDKKDYWLNALDEQRNTCLHVAARNGNPNILSLLIAQGADVNACNMRGEVPLSLGARSSTSEAVTRLLLAAGADANGGDQAKGKPLSAAVYGNNANVVSQLLEAGADPGADCPLLTALSYNYPAIAKALLEKGAPIDDGWRDTTTSPLHYAARNNMLEVAKILLEKGADINARDSNGYAPLHLVAYNGKLAMAEFLVAAGADTTIHNNEGKTPLDRARDGREKAVILLLERVEQERVEQEALKKLTPALPGAVDGSAQDTEEWHRMGTSKVALVGTYPAMGRRLTEIFNFDSRDRLIIAENLRTGAENVTPPESFDAIGEEPVKKALEAFRRLGGKADADKALGRLEGKPDTRGRQRPFSSNP